MKDQDVVNLLKEENNTIWNQFLEKIIFEAQEIDLINSFGFHVC